VISIATLKPASQLAGRQRKPETKLIAVTERGMKND
jgi:hypothetical protein